MTEQKWEYCSLHLQKDVKRLQCWVEYCSATRGSIITVLAKTAADVSLDLYARVMAQLGAIGWELVNVQHGNLVVYTVSGTYVDTLIESSLDTLSVSNKIAYFKRQVQAGRAVNEPKISIVTQG